MIQPQDTPMPQAEAKTARKELKLQPSVLAAIQAAAGHLGMDTSTFIATAAYARAREIAQAQITTTLPPDRFAAFAAAVAREGAANEALTGSIARSRILFADG